MTTVVAWIPRETVDFEFDYLGYLNKDDEEARRNSKPEPTVFLDDLHIAADSRISGPGGGSLSDMAAKVLPLPVQFFQDWEDGPGCRPTWQSRWGFAFAGSTLAANIIYGIAANSLTTLRGPFNAAYPEFKHFVRFIANVADGPIRDVRGQFEAFLVGGTPGHQTRDTTELWRIRWCHQQARVCMRQIDLKPQGTFSLLGDEKGRMRERIEAGFGKDPTFDPLTVVKDRIAEAQGSIGGFISMGTARDGWFSIDPGYRVEADGRAVSLLGELRNSGLGSIGSYRVSSLVG